MHESVMQDCFLLWMIHLSRRRHIHNSIQRVLHKTDKRNWISEVNVCGVIRSHHENLYITLSSSETAVLLLQ